MTLFSKDGTNFPTVEKTWPLTVPNHIFKIVEEAILQKANSKQFYKILETGLYQTGFKEGMNTQMNVTDIMG